MRMGDRHSVCLPPIRFGSERVKQALMLATGHAELLLHAVRAAVQVRPRDGRVVGEHHVADRGTREVPHVQVRTRQAPGAAEGTVLRVHAAEDVGALERLASRDQGGDRLAGGLRHVVSFVWCLSDK